MGVCIEKGAGKNIPECRVDMGSGGETLQLELLGP